MFEDDVFKFLNSHNEQNFSSIEAVKSSDGTKESGASSSLPQHGHRYTDIYKRLETTNQINDLNRTSGAHAERKNVTEYLVNTKFQDSHPKNVSFFLNQSGEVKTEFRKRKIYEIDVHRSAYIDKKFNEWRTSSCENLSASHNTATGTDRLRDDLKRMSLLDFDKCVNYEKVSPGDVGLKIPTSYMQKVGKKEVLTNSGETTQEKIIQKIPSEKKNLKKRIYFSCPSKETEELLDDAIQDFNPRHNEYMSFGDSCVKNGKKSIWYENPTSKGQFRSYPNEICYNRDIKTLGDSLKYFDLTSHLQQLEMNLENLRRNKITKEVYEEIFKGIDKEIQKLSFKYHPDKVKNKGGTEKDIEKAQKEQTALNSTRTALKFLNSAFMEDIATDHKFGFYTNLNIESLCNEDEMKQRVYEVIFKIGMISRIKQQNIISEIRKFLIESKLCVDSYLRKLPNDFEKQRDIALFHLKCCVKGFKKLCAELEEVKIQCESEENGRNMLPLICKMERESKRDLKLLKSLKKTAKTSMKGMYQFFSPVEKMDPYFVLPLVSYINVILMCNVMIRNASVFESFINNIIAESDPNYRNDLRYLLRPYYLASFCSGNKNHAPTVLKIMNEMRSPEQPLQLPISKQEIELAFCEYIRGINVFMENKFRVEEYNETMPVNLFALDLKKCMKMMAEFEAKEQKVSKGIEEFQKKAELMDEKYAKFDKMMEEAAALNREYKERVEKNKKLSEQFSNAISDQIQK